MRNTLEPRKIPLWKFFNEHPEVCVPVRSAGLQGLKADDRRAAELFVGALGGCKEVLDWGCGLGFPGLYIAPHVDRLVGIDAAPNLVALARASALSLGVWNASFVVGGGHGLPFREGQFSGSSLCGVLESMDWGSVHRTLSDLWRVLASGARVAVLDQDWQHVLRTRPAKEANVRSDKGCLILQVVERSAFPAVEKDTRYLIRAEGALARKLRDQLQGKTRVPTTVSPEDLSPWDVVDVWFDEAAQFDAEALRHLIVSKGFREVWVDFLPLWHQEVLFLTAPRPAGDTWPGVRPLQGHV